MKNEEWQEDILDQINEMNDATLFESILWLSVGDSFEGDFTTRGMWVFKTALREYEKRKGYTEKDDSFERFKY